MLAVVASILLFKQKQSFTPQGHNMEEMNGRPVAQSHRSYEIEVTSKSDNINPNQPAVFKFKIKNDKGDTLKNYSVVHTKIMHFIIVRKDLQYFQHLHPDFDKDSGVYSIAVTFPADGPYRLFPDFTPAASEDNPQQLTVTLNADVNVGDMNKYTAKPVIPDNNNLKTVNGYTINYDIPKELKSQTEISYSLNVEKNRQSISDLENYLGALGHGVILKEGTLDFIHTHAGEVKQAEGAKMDHGSSMMNKDTSKGPKIDFSTSFPESGRYKIFTQFQHAGKVITTDYVVTVR